MGSYNEPEAGYYVEPAPEAPPDQGGGPITTVVEGPGPAGANLDAIYQQYLGRGVDESGAGTFAGMSAQDVINAIQSSPEYAARATAGQAPGVGGGGTDLSSIYQQYLGRGVDQSGAATFAGQSAQSVIDAILNSPEYASRYASLGGAGGGALPAGAATALAAMDVAPAWLPQSQYAQYGFNAQGRRDKEEGLATFLQTKTPEGVPAAPKGFTYAGTKSSATDEYSGILTHSYNDDKGGTLTIDQYGNTQYTAGNKFYEEQLAKHPNAIATGYRNQQYLSRNGIDQTVNIPGIGPVEVNQAFLGENIYNPNTKQLYKDKSGNFVQRYEPQGGGGFNNIMEQLVNTGLMVAGTAVGGPAGAAATAAFLSASNDAKIQDVLRNAAIAGGTAYLGGEIFGDGGQSLFGPLGDSIAIDPTTLADMDLGNAMRNMANVGPEAGLPTLENSFNPEVSIEPTSGLPTLEANVITPETSAATNTLTQTYPDINVGPPIEPTALTPLEIQAAQLPMDTTLPPGTLSASTNNAAYLPANSSPDVLIETAKENAKRGVSSWWQVTGNPVVDAGIRQAVYGAAMGGATSGITGGSVSKGALYGGIAGGVTGAGGEYLGGKFYPEGFNPTGNNVANAGIRSGLYGAANSAIASQLAGGDPGKAAIIGGLISGVAGSGFQALDDYYARQYEAPDGVRRFPTRPELIESQEEFINRMNNLKYGEGTGQVNPYKSEFGGMNANNRITRPSGLDLDTGMPGTTPGRSVYGLNLETSMSNPINPFNAENPYGAQVNPRIENMYGGAGNLNPNLDYINQGLANNVQALSQASGIPIDPQIFNATGALSAKDAFTLDQAITNAEEIGIPYSDIIKDMIIPFLGFIPNPPGKNQAPSSSGPSSSPPKKPTKVPKRAGGKGNFDNYLLKNKVYAGNVYTPEATGYQSVGYKEGGEVQHYDIGGSISSGLTNLFKPVEKAVIQPIGQAAPFLKDVLPYAAMAAAPFLGPTAAAGLGALGSGFGTTPGAGFNMKRALMGGIASYGLSNIGSGLAEAGMQAQTPMSLGSIEEPLVGGALKTTAPNPATTSGFWDQITNKASNMQQGVGNLMKGGESFDAAAKAFGTKAGMGSAGMAIMGGTGVLGVDEADAQNQAVEGTNSAAAQQQSILANRRAQAKANAQNAVAANPFRFDMGGMVNPPDDQTNMPNRTPLTRIEQTAPIGYALGGMANVPRFLSGGGDGMSDSIKANIEGTQEARLADGEFVIPADVVSHLGNGSSKAGAKQLYSMMDRIRQARTGRKAQGREVNPHKFMPM